MSMNKKDIINMLEEIALYLELKGENPFRIAAYRRAAQSLERDERSLSEIKDFTKIKGIGEGTNALIEEYLEEGTSKLLEELKTEVPEGLIPLLNLPGLGGKRIAKLYQELEIVDSETLKAACVSGEIEKLSGFGKKTTENILQALQEEGSRPERLSIAVMLPIAAQIESQLSTIDSIEKFSRAGSLRRMRETIKDIDFIIATNQPEKTRDALLELQNIKAIIAQGKTKVSITIADQYDIDVDFRLVSSEEYATTLHHFTGSKEHNVLMRQLAKERGEKISEYGIELKETSEIKTFNNEEAFFKHFNLHYIPPENREGKDEIEAFKSEVDLIQFSDIRGDLHMHTTWSDGAQSIEEMVSYAREIGYEYIAITDHSKFLQVANGLNETKLRRQKEEIERINEKYTDIHVFAGVEMDILPDGTLDFSNEFLKEMDFVIGAIHSGFSQSQDEIMNRMYQALDNPYVNLIAHPTGRLIGRRDGYAIDLDKVIERAKETNTALEINSNPNRFDLSAYWAEKAQEIGATLAINTDAHNYDMLNHMKYGISVGKKGWIQQGTVMNTWSLDKVKQFINKSK